MAARKPPPQLPKKKEAAALDSALFEAAKRGEAHETQRLLALGADPLAIRSCALAVACRRANACAAILAPFDHCREVATFAAQSCAESGLVEALKILAPKADLEANDGSMLRKAARAGHLACVEFLAPLCRKDTAAEALVDAAQGQHPECLEALIRRLPKRESGDQGPAAFALEIAAANGCARSCLALLEVCDRQCAILPAMARAAGAFEVEAMRVLAPLCDPADLSAIARAVLLSASRREGWDKPLQALRFLAQAIPGADAERLAEQAQGFKDPQIDAILAPIARAAHEARQLSDASTPAPPSERSRL